MGEEEGGEGAETLGVDARYVLPPRPSPLCSSLVVTFLSLPDHSDSDFSMRPPVTGMTLDLTSLFQAPLAGAHPDGALIANDPAQFATPPPSPDPSQIRPQPVQVVSSFVDPVGGWSSKGKGDGDAFPGGYPSPGLAGRKPKKGEQQRRAGRSLNAGTT